MLLIYRVSLILSLILSSLILSPPRRTFAPPFTQLRDLEYGSVGSLEDNPRSDLDKFPQWPRLVIPSFGPFAFFDIECGFSPPDLGSYIIWSISGERSDWVVGNESGSFSDSNPVEIFLDLPSTGDFSQHDDWDLVVDFGADLNSDGFLAEQEKFPGLRWYVRAIPEHEWQYCKGKMAGWLVNLSTLLMPDAAESMDIFLGLNMFAGYDAVEENVPINFAEYDQKNGLGCDAVSLTQGLVDRYVFNSDPMMVNQSLRLVTDLEFWNTVIVPCITSMNIESWFENNPNENSHEFPSNFNGSVILDNSPNLQYGLHGFGVNLTCNATAVRSGQNDIRITAMSINGTVTDIYDWPSGGSDLHNDYASRLQTCYSPILKPEGKIFRILINIDHSGILTYGSQAPYLHNDFDGLFAAWSSYIISLPIGPGGP